MSGHLTEEEEKTFESSALNALKPCYLLITTFIRLARPGVIVRGYGVCEAKSQ